MVMPSGARSLVDLPGSYSLRGRAPTRRSPATWCRPHPGEAPPEVVLVVADATNLGDHPLRARTEAHRPAAAAGAQHVRYRHTARRHRGCAASVRGARDSRRDLDRGAQGRHRRTAAPDRRDHRGRGAGAANNQSRQPLRWRNCAPPSARPTASSPRPSACRPGPTPGPRGSTPCCCIPWLGPPILFAAAVRDLPGGVRLGDAVRRSARRRRRRADRAAPTTPCPRACCAISCRTACFPGSAR